VTEAGGRRLERVRPGCLPAIRRSRRRFAGSCLGLDPAPARNLNGAPRAAITARLLDLGWIERGSQPAGDTGERGGAGGLAKTFGRAAED